MPTYEQLEAEIEEAQRLGDLDRMDELLAQVSGLASGDTAEASPPSDDETDETDEPEATDQQPGEGEDPDRDGEPRRDAPVVRARDGVNEIPYEVLEAERLASAEAREQIAELQRQLEEARQSGQQTGDLQGSLEELQAMNQLLIEQIKEAGMSPRTTPDKFELSDDAKRELREEYGVVGSTIADLADAVAALRGRVTADVSREIAPRAAAETAPATKSSIQEIIQSDPNLSRWIQDPMAWAVAQQVDAQLAQSPGYAGKSFSDRRAEVVAVTRQRLGEAPARSDEQTRQKADAVVQEASRVPASLTDVGGGSRDAEKPIAEELSSMSQTDIQARLEALYERGGQKAVDAFLEQALSG